MLDDANLISQIDKSDILSKIYRLPEQIQETQEIVKDTHLENIYKVDNIIISGMGASGITGEIIQKLFRDRLNIPIYINRRYDLPKWAHKNTLLISQSYSGNTEETLSAFKNGFQKRCKIIGISSGGKLEEYCKGREVPHIKIPSNYPPRTATGYILFSSILALKNIGILNFDLDAEIQDSISVTDELRNHVNKEKKETENIAKQIAKKIHGLIPQIYGYNEYVPIARRWCTQFNENSKIHSRSNVFPELNHNETVGYDAPERLNKNHSVILIRDQQEPPEIRNRIETTADLVLINANKVMEIKAKGEGKLAKMLSIMCIGDYTSVYLAILQKKDPTPVKIIDRVKSELAKKTRMKEQFEDELIQLK